MKRRILATLALMLILVPLAQAREAREPRIQIALLLDTSGSMSGLIDHAKSQLWRVVNEFALSRKGGRPPRLEVALFHYGNNGLDSREGYVKMLMPLSDDLDKVSEHLFALTTNGGEEYCGAVIKTAVEALAWSDSSDDLKAIFIAGNEPFTQGGVDYRQSCKAAIAKGVIVNTIHCGGYEEGVNGKWRDGALLADGQYMHIDHNYRADHIEAPQDAEIVRLNGTLNDTYIPYGASGRKREALQAEQDANAAKFSMDSMVQRSVAKSSGQYRNTAWDLVDAMNEGKVDVSKLKDSDLPEAMRKMSVDERNAYIKGKSSERERIQKRIAELNAERRRHVAEVIKKRTGEEPDTLDAAMIKMARTQATAKDFVFTGATP